MTDFATWLGQASPEQCVPVLWDNPSPIAANMYQLLIIQAFRPDRVIAAAQQLVAAVLGASFMPKAERELDLASIVDRDLSAATPALLCSVTGYDASGIIFFYIFIVFSFYYMYLLHDKILGRVDDLATELNKQISSIAIGSAEGFNQAERAINMACKTGRFVCYTLMLIYFILFIIYVLTLNYRWVMLKNVHLAPSWLVQLEKKLHSLQPHPGFRLFLTTEISPKLPTNLLRYFIL